MVGLPKRLLAVVALAAWMIAGCTPSAEEGTVLTFWGMGREGEIVAQLMPGFERSHPGVRVRVQQIPWSAAHEKLLTAFVGGSLPDAFQLGNTWVPELAAIGALAPLDAHWNDPEFERADFFPGVLDTNVIDGTTRAVPWYVDTRLLFYRKDLLAAAGYPEAPRTWQEWREMMERLRTRAPDRYAILLSLAEWQPLVMFGLESGATLLTDQDQRGNFESPPFRRAYEFYLGLMQDGLAPRAGEGQLANLYQEFASGRIVFFISGPWNLGELPRRLPAELADSWAVAPMPAATAEHPYPGVSLAGGSSLAIAAGSPRAELAWQLLVYLSSRATQLEIYRLSGDLPSRRSAWAEGKLAADPRTGAFEQQLQHVVSTPKIPEWERIATKIMQYTERALHDGESVERSLAALDVEVDRILEKRRSLQP